MILLAFTGLNYKDMMISYTKGNEDLEATDNELKGVVYTVLALAAFLVLVTGSIIYMLL